MNRYQLIRYLVAHVYPSQPGQYKDAVNSALNMQTTETLLAMAKLTQRSELERKEKARQARIAREGKGNEHTTPYGAH